MTRTRNTLTREEAAAFTAALEGKAEAVGIPLDQWILRPGKPNDIRLGPGPRFAIVQRAHESAAIGGRYGQVLGSVVIQGNGEPYKIRTHDLAGFVIANGYCEAVPPTEIGTSPHPAPEDALQRLEQTGEDSWPPPKAPLAQVSNANAVSETLGRIGSPCEPLKDLLAEAYPCPCFKTVCQSMRWNPEAGHIPRGFLGAIGRPEEVELVLVFAEPGDPRPGDHATMDEALTHAYWAFGEGQGQFHQNARYLLDLCWPELRFDQQLRRVWLTESVLCSAEVSTGPVPKVVEQTCGERYLKNQIRLFPGALVVALGMKATDRLHRIGITEFETAFALGKPGCNQAGARPSWLRIAAILDQMRKGASTV